MKHSPQEAAILNLNGIGLVYALIREPTYWADTGDIDILVGDLGRAGTLLEKSGYIPFEKTENSSKYIRYCELCNVFIHLDLHLRICFGGLVAPLSFTNALIDFSVSGSDGIRRLRTIDQLAIYVWQAAIDKGKLDGKYIKPIPSDEMINLSSLKGPYCSLPPIFRQNLSIVELFLCNQISEECAIKMLRESDSLTGFKRDHLLVRILRRLFELNPNRKVIAFLGPDGAGKSTLIDRLKGLRWPKIKFQYMGPRRESEMRYFLFRAIKHVSDVARKFSKRTVTGTAARIGYHMLCYLDFIDRIYRNFRYWSARGIVVFDRYACDMFFRAPSKFGEIVYLALFPKPRFVFLCVGDPEKIFRRKPEELTAKQIADMVDLYRTILNKYKIPFVELDTTECSPPEVLNKILKTFSENNWFR